MSKHPELTHGGSRGGEKNLVRESGGLGGKSKNPGKFIDGNFSLKGGGTFTGRTGLAFGGGGWGRLNFQ